VITKVSGLMRRRRMFMVVVESVQSGLSCQYLELPLPSPPLGKGREQENSDSPENKSFSFYSPLNKGG
jgi:hypothetical protein